MKVLILGSGGREYTFCHQLAKSPHQPKLFIAPGNAGTAHFGTNIEVSPTDFEGLKQAVLAHEIEMVIVGPCVHLNSYHIESCFYLWMSMVTFLQIFAK